MSPAVLRHIVKGETGAGYTGETQKEFTISKLPQELDLGQEEISLNEKEETKIDLSVLTGQITVTPSEEGFVEIRELLLRFTCVACSRLTLDNDLCSSRA